MKFYKIQANSVVLLHTLIILTNLASLPVLFFNYSLGLWFAASAAFAPLSWLLLNDHCMLTTLEKKLRAKYDKAAIYPGGCIAHYGKKWLGLKIADAQVTIFIWSYLALVLLTAIALKP